MGRDFADHTGMLLKTRNPPPSGLVSQTAEGLDADSLGASPVFSAHGSLRWARPRQTRPIPLAAFDLITYGRF